MTKTVFVTGGAIRVGQATAVAFARAGYDVALSSHHSSLDETCALVRAAGQRAYRFSADLSQSEEVARLGAEVCAQVGTLDAVVHNAGIFQRRDFAAITRADWDTMLAVNLSAPFFLTQALLPALADDACVIFLADILAERCPPGYAHYMVSKAGLVALVRGLSVELAPLRVNAVAPGTVLFPPGYDATARARITQKIPLQTQGSPEDVASAALFLARSPFVSGQILAVDGGRSAVH